ncbi:hypothetical protein [Desulfurispora thermophila]|nr:hypothetical protein [Desulfurispora thermophila]
MKIQLNPGLIALKPKGNVIHGQPVLNQGALANPGALAYFSSRAELED